MHSLMVKKDFIVRHFLTGKDWGKESEIHSHHYVMELEIKGKTLDSNNFLIDIVELNKVLNESAEYFQDHVLNSLPEFKDQNPSLELFAKILCEKINKRLNSTNISSLSVRLWENPEAWAGYEITL